MIEEELFDRLLPLSPEERYVLMTTPSLQPVLGASVGDTVWCLDSRGQKDIGMIRYIGPIKGLGSGFWFGVELILVWTTILQKLIPDFDQGVISGEI